MNPSTASRLLLIAALQLPIVAHAQSSGTVFRSVDEQGRVIFSDRPSDDAETVNVHPANTMRVAPSEPRTISAQEAPPAVTGYAALRINAPPHDSLVRSNLGEIAVAIHIEPALQAGHRMQLLLDGSVAGEPDSGSWLLEGVAPGSHILQLQILDQDGQIIFRSDSSTVHLQRSGRRRPVAVPTPH